MIYLVYGGTVEPRVIMVTFDKEYAYKVYREKGLILEIWGDKGTFYSRVSKLSEARQARRKATKLS